MTTLPHFAAQQNPAAHRKHQGNKMNPKPQHSAQQKRNTLQPFSDPSSDRVGAACRRIRNLVNAKLREIRAKRKAGLLPEDDDAAVDT
jgi:hypothetical protein